MLAPTETNVPQSPGVVVVPFVVVSDGKNSSAVSPL
jgi:hypothetical protein